MGQLYQWEPFTEGEVSSPPAHPREAELASYWGMIGRGRHQPLYFSSVGAGISRLCNVCFLISQGWGEETAQAGKGEWVSDRA